MSLMAVFNCSFFIILILFLLIIGLIWIHFNTKINNQNINMNQMVRLLSTMTQEVSLLRKKVGLSFNEEVIDLSEDNINQEIKQEKINVSDDESDSDLDDSDSNSDDSDEDSDEDSDNESDNELSNDNDSSPIELEIEELKTVQLNNLEVQLEESENQLNKLEEQLNKLEEIEDKIEDELEEVVEEELEEKLEEQLDKEEYKKMSLNKLKSLVLEKKLTSDVSKLKKNDLLTILGIE